MVLVNGGKPVEGKGGSVDDLWASEAEAIGRVKACKDARKVRRTKVTLLVEDMSLYT